MGCYTIHMEQQKTADQPRTKCKVCGKALPPVEKQTVIQRVKGGHFTCVDEAERRENMAALRASWVD